MFDINASPTQAPGKLINLAYLTIKGEEHYEAVESITCSTTKNIENVTCYTATKLANGNENVDESGMNIPEYYTLETPIDESSVDGQACSPDGGNSQIHDINMAHNEEIPCFTPHKRADYNSLLKKISSRKKKANPEKWKRNIRKQCRSSRKL